MKHKEVSLASVLKVVLWSLSLEEYTNMLTHLSQQELINFGNTYINHSDMWIDRWDRYDLILKRMAS